MTIDRPGRKMTGPLTSRRLKNPQSEAAQEKWGEDLLGMDYICCALRLCGSNDHDNMIALPLDGKNGKDKLKFWDK